MIRRTIGMSQMSSMLRDLDRNKVYELALQACISYFISHNSDQRHPIVLDIGTGSGLLAMFAARHGAEFVIGCEMFEEMATIAESVVERNNFNDKIQIIPAKSTDIDSLLPIQPDILVSELLDSALLGESCMFCHADAISRFMKFSNETNNNEDLIPIAERVIPYNAEVYATLIECEEIKHLVSLEAISLHGSTPYRDEAARGCRGGWPLIPVHWREMEARGGKKLSQSQVVLVVDFYHGFDSNKKEFPIAGDGIINDDDNDIDMVNGDEMDREKEENEIEKEDYDFGEGCFETDVLVTTEGTVHAVLLWWNTFLLSPIIDPERKLSYSTAPEAQNWQDHWLQVVFPLPESIDCKIGDVIRLKIAHDSLRLWLIATPVILRKEKDEEECNHNLMSTFVIENNDEVLTNQSKKAKTLATTASNQEENGDSVMLNTGVNDTRFSSSIAKVVSPVAFCDRLLPAQCECGWHLLCGTERLQTLNDQKLNQRWESAIDDVINSLVVNNQDKSLTSSTSNDNNMRIILDVSDGSLLSLGTSLAIKKQKLIVSSPKIAVAESTKEILIGTLFDSLKVVSIEKKQFSRLFNDQLITANDIDDIMMIWDGNDWNDITDYFHDNTEADDVEVSDDDVNNITRINNSAVVDEEDSLSSQTSSFPVISALITDCFFFQLHALPTWQAFSFHYIRCSKQISSHLVDNQTLIVPGKAYFMAAAIELIDLAESFGTVGR